jgi:hypothetical protein
LVLHLTIVRQFGYLSGFYEDRRSQRWEPQNCRFNQFKCEFISNRGTKVWPGFVSPDLLQVINWYRCRFMAPQNVQDASRFPL